MNVPLLTAGLFMTVAAGIHGGAGETLVVRKLSAASLPPTRLGGPNMTRAMIHASWHIATVAFVVIAGAFVLAGAVLHGATAHGFALLAAVATSGFAALIVGLGATALSPRAFFRHPAPALLTITVALAWWGAL
jgi:uncharacterized protein YjbI with pentapeptide repeats